MSEPLHLLIGPQCARIDGPLKVTGTARYPSDQPLSHPAHAFLITSAIARGRVRSIDGTQARRVPGFLDLLTHENVGSLAKTPPPPGGKGKATTTSLESQQVWHDGQIIAVVVAETYEAARECASRMRVSYETEQPSATFGTPGAEEAELCAVDDKHKDPCVGDAESTSLLAPVRVDENYSTPTQHHNPLELFTTSCFWEGDHLVIYEPSQFVRGLAAGVAKQLGLSPQLVRVRSEFIGGAFGSRGGITHRTAWIAIAARRLKRPVKLVATRDQGFTIATYRAETRHRVRLGATPDGRLLSLIHESWEATSRPSTYNVSGTETTSRVYACPNVSTRVNIVHLDRNTPGFMRAPPDTPYMFALESAMDELACALKMDPIELRRLNDTQNEPIKGLPYTSRSLMRCFDEGAARFGWANRNPEPGSMGGSEWKIGLGCATAAYPSNIAPAAARLKFHDDRALVQLAAHDIGTGTYTAIAVIVSQYLRIEVENVTVEIGDSDLPPAGLAAGSSHAASVCNVVAKACTELLSRRQASPDVNEVYVENVPDGAPPDGIAKVGSGQMAMARGNELEDRIAYGFGAQFVEVHVHTRTCEIRVPRMLGAFAAGTIINPLTARSQLMGGMIWGMSAALLEATEIDRRVARYYNDDLAEYLVPVNADIGTVDVLMVPEQDTRVNPLGIKGVGELGTVGMNAAVANAVYHATGRRIRDLPIRIEKLL